MTSNFLKPTAVTTWLLPSSTQPFPNRLKSDSIPDLHHCPTHFVIEKKIWRTSAFFVISFACWKRRFSPLSNLVNANHDIDQHKCRQQTFVTWQETLLPGELFRFRDLIFAYEKPKSLPKIVRNFNRKKLFKLNSFGVENESAIVESRSCK